MDDDRSDGEFDSEEEEDEEEPRQPRFPRNTVNKMMCRSCREEYEQRDAGTCRDCYEEASETEAVLEQQIEDLRSRVEFLRFSWGSPPMSPPPPPPFSDVLLVASDDTSTAAQPAPIPAHRAVLAGRSPVFRAMLENQMEESLSGIIKIGDVSYDVLRIFVNYLYTAEACIDSTIAYDLLVLADKYQVQHLKTFCEKFLLSVLSWENAIPIYAFAHQHNVKTLLNRALSIILSDMERISKREDYAELVEKDPRMVVEIYEAYLKKQVNTAANRHGARWP